MDGDDGYTANGARRGMTLLPRGLISLIAFIAACEAQVEVSDVSASPAPERATGTAGSGADAFGDLQGRTYFEAHGWACSDTTCVAKSRAVRMPDAVFEPFEPDREESTRWLPDPPDGVAVAGAELHLPQLAALSRTGVHSSEPDATYFRTDSTSTSSMNVFANQHFTGSLLKQTNVLAHGCTTTYTGSWCVRGHVLVGNTQNPPRQWKGVDPAAMFENAGTNYLHVITLNESNPDSNGGAITGFNWYSKSGDPCPASCGTQTWNECGIGLPSGVTAPDYPQAIYDPTTDRKWLLYNAVSGGNNKLVLTELHNGSNCGTSGSFVRACTGSNSEFFGRAAVDAAGTLHVVYFDYTNSSNIRLRYTTFDTNTNTWSCSNANLDQYVPPTGSNTTCVPMQTTTIYTGIGNNNLRENRSASIAIDDTVSPWKTINVVLTTRDTVNGYEAQARIYRKVIDWLPIGGTTGTNYYHSRIVFDRTPFSALADRYHFISVHDTNFSQNGSTADVVSWKSTDGGLSYLGQIISTAFQPTHMLGCYWGDYEAIAADRANAVVFYGWTTPGSGLFNIQGRGIEE